MTDGLRLFGQGLVILGVFAEGFAALGPAALFHEVSSQVEIPALPRQAKELDESDLDFLVAGQAAALSRTEDRVHQVGVFEGDVEKASFPRGRIMRRRRLIEMAGVVEFVAPAEVGPAFRSVDPEHEGV